MVKRYERITELIKAYIEGDLSYDNDVKQLQVKDYSEINKCLRKQKIRLMLTKNTVIKLLTGFLNNEIPVNKLALWGKFIFHSYMGTESYEPMENDEPLEKLVIEWEGEYEESMANDIAEVIMKLECFGDKIDGEFTKEDAKKAIELLKSKKKIK